MSERRGIFTTECPSTNTVSMVQSASLNHRDAGFEDTGRAIELLNKVNVASKKGVDERGCILLRRWMRVRAD